MGLYIAFFSSAAVLLAAIVLAIVLAKVKYRAGRTFNALHMLFCGVLISSVIMFYPIYHSGFSQAVLQVPMAVLLSIHNTIRLFIVDGEFEIVGGFLVNTTGWVPAAYALLAAVQFVMAPLLTFGMVLSFFKNISAYLRYCRGYFRETYVFSELNDRALALARDLKTNDKRRMIVFAGVRDALSEEMELALELNAVIFRKDIEALNLSFHGKNRGISFFAIGKDDESNVQQALDIIEKYRSRENTSLYVFSITTDCELLLNTVDKGFVRVRRVNEVASLISRTLYDEGLRIFEGAADEGGPDRRIRALVVGMGAHGTEMAKALSWFTQMDGYLPEIDAFDLDPLADERFRLMCPELMDEKFNGDFTTDGEAHYRLTIHGGVDVGAHPFARALDTLAGATYIFVALGDDELNIRTAVWLRAYFEKRKMHPCIDAIVYSKDKKAALTGIRNYSGQSYDIHFIGDLATSYSEDVILDSDVEEAALQRHLKWGEEEEFWQYEYNYRSSIASAIHRVMKIRCGIPGVAKPPEERTEEELWALRKMEHRRWNAYMRSEGYCYSGSTEKSSRNNLAKTHHCLVPFAELTLAEQLKDGD